MQQKSPASKESSGRAPDIPNGEAHQKQSVRIDQIIGDGRDPGAPADRRDDSSVRANPRLCDQTASECPPEDSFVHKILIERKKVPSPARLPSSRKARPHGERSRDSVQDEGRVQSNFPVETTTAFLRCAPEFLVRADN